MSDEPRQQFDLVWMQRLGGGTEVLERNIPASAALARLQQADREDHGAGGICFSQPAGTPTLAELEAQLHSAQSVVETLKAWLAGNASMSALRVALATYAHTNQDDQKEPSQ